MSMVTKRPQLSLDELHQLKWWLGSVLGLLSAWTVAFMDVNAWWLLALVTLAGGWVLVRPSLPQSLPTWVHRLAFPVIVAVLAIDFLLYREPLPAFIRLNLMLIGYRLISPRRRRDDLQLIVLGLFMVVVAGVLTVSIGFAVQILAFTACALGFLLTITLVDAASVSTASASGGAPAWALNVRWGDLGRRVLATTDWRIAVLGTALFGGVVIVSGLLFLAIPRFELSNSFFLDRLISRQTRTGFSDEIRFGEVTDIQQDNRLALSVDVSDRSQVPAEPYWRMVVLDEYVAGGFRVSSALRTELSRRSVRTMRVTGTGRFRPGAAEWTFYFEPGVSRYLPLLGNFQAIKFTESQSVGMSDPLNVVALERDPPRMLAYQVQGMNVTGPMMDATFALARRNGNAPRQMTSLGEALNAADWRRLASVNADITGGATLTPSDYAQRASSWLGERHAYSLQSTVPAGEGDPLVRWIESDQPGHCELFAGALVLLAREAGIPARIVTGFRGGSWNGFSGNFTVRNAHAHAWTELFDDSVGGWLRVDPTPGSRSTENAGEEGQGEEALRRMTDNSWSARLESMRVFWYRRIVNFDQGTQVELARAAKEAVDDTGRRLRARLEQMVGAVKAWWAQPWGLERFGVIAALAVAMAGAILGWRRWGVAWWLRWRSGHARRSGLDPVRREAGRWLRRFGESGVAEEGLTSELQRLRYGPRSTWGNPSRVFKEARQAQRSSKR